MNKKMSALRNYLNKIKPNFQKGGKLHAFESVFDGFKESVIHILYLQLRCSDSEICLMRL